MRDNTVIATTIVIIIIIIIATRSTGVTTHAPCCRALPAGRSHPFDLFSIVAIA
jgi:hypothetical protein